MADFAMHPAVERVLAERDAVAQYNAKCGRVGGPSLSGNATSRACAPDTGVVRASTGAGGRITVGHARSLPVSEMRPRCRHRRVNLGADRAPLRVCSLADR
jgi:hypothetical protein